MALIDGLVAYYKLDEASGHLIDSHGTHDSTSELNISYGATGVINDAISFGGDGWADVDAHADLEFSTGAFSLQTWLKPVSSDYSNSIVRIGNPWGAGGFYFGTGTTGLGQFQIWITASDYVYSNDPPSTVAFSHVVAVREAGGAIRLYVNSVLQDGTGSSSASMPQVTMTIGADNAHAGGFTNGNLDEIGIWKGVALSQAQVTELYNSGAGLAYPFAAVGTNTQIQIGGAWKEIPAMQIQIGGAWKEVAGMQEVIDDGGKTWKEVF